MSLGIRPSHHGKFLGQQWDSIWTILRIIFGTLCMVPLKYGFNIAQIIVLGCILLAHMPLLSCAITSLHNVYTGTTLTVPASAMDIVKQAIANKLVMATYNAETHNKYPSSISLFNETTGNLIPLRPLGYVLIYNNLLRAFVKWR